MLQRWGARALRPDVEAASTTHERQCAVDRAEPNTSESYGLRVTILIVDKMSVSTPHAAPFGRAPCPRRLSQRNANRGNGKHRMRQVLLDLACRPSDFPIAGVGSR